MSKTVTFPVSTIPETVDQFIKDYKLNDLFAERIDEIRGDLEKQWGKISDKEKLERSKNKLGQIVKEIHESANLFKNVKRQEREIRRFELSEIPDLKDALNCTNDHIINNSIKFQDIPSLNSEEFIEWVKRNDSPIIHSQNPSNSYRRALLEAKSQTLDDVRSAEIKFFALTKEGRDATSKEIQDVRVSKKYSPLLRTVQSYGETLLELGIKAINYLGRGTIAESNIADDSRYQQHLENYKNFLREIKYKLGSGKEHSFSSIERLKKMIEQNGGLPLSDQQFSQIQQEIAAEISALQKIDQAELDHANKSLKASHDDFTKNLKNDLSVEDSRFPLIAVQLLLLVTPLAGLSFVPMLTNIVAPMVQAGSFGGSVAGVVGNIPVIGDFARLIKMDFAIEWLADNLPIVSDLGEVFGFFTNNEITQNAFGVVLGAEESPVLAYALAGFFFSQFADQMLQQKKNQNPSESLDTAISSINGQIEDNKSKRKELDREFSTKVDKIIGAEFSQKSKIDEVSSIEESKSNIYGNLEISKPDGKKVGFVELLTSDKNKAIEYLKLEQNEQVLEKLYKTRCAHHHLGDEEFNKIKGNPDEIEKFSKLYNKQKLGKQIEKIDVMSGYLREPISYYKASGRGVGHDFGRGGPVMGG